LYIWRNLPPEQREEVLLSRKEQHRPWHGPPMLFREGQFHLSSACYEHAPHIGRDPARLATFSQQLLEVFDQKRNILFAWCVLPNHYHLMVQTFDLKGLKKEVGVLHGRTSYEWNLEESTSGRTVWHRCADRSIRSERHYWATINYIHNNPVHHGYVKIQTDWPFSSVRDFIEQVGEEQTIFIWKEYPVFDYGKGWDDPEM
jgi:REP-associated tyrosine transposase